MTNLHGRTASLLLCLVLLAGCGGGGGNGGGGAPDEEVSPFADSYAGTFNAPSTGDNGTVDVVILNDGTVSGTLFSTPRNAEGPINGSIAADGTFTGTMQVAGTPEATLSGTFSEGSNGHVTGTLQSTSGDVTFDLVPRV
ncbi:hypothetical protein EON82_18545 [bacterium]|nr:MAG: hypothetical protein EON82_18545 [bacterium]